MRQEGYGGKRGRGVSRIAHLIHRLDIGGLENGLVHLINNTPADRYDHAIICMTEYTDFVKKIDRSDVPVFALHKREGQDPRAYLRLWRLLRRLRPQILHTRNLAALEGVLMGALAGVPCRIHGEHGRDVHDLRLDNRRYRRLRRILRPFVSHYVALSDELADYLRNQVGVPPHRLSRIHNGVDSGRYHPSRAGREALPVEEFAPPGSLVVGTVGRLEPVKDQITLTRAFVSLLRRVPEARARLRLVIVGDGSLRPGIEGLLRDAGAEDLAWLAGNRNDVPAILRGLDLFVLPSLAEGHSNGILEAMASGLPVVATQVGGNPELVVDGTTGYLVPPADAEALASAIERYLDQPELGPRHGAAGRRRIEEGFSLERMVERYLSLYDSVMRARA